jgi:hypothetical protein
VPDSAPASPSPAISAVSSAAPAGAAAMTPSANAGLPAAAAERGLAAADDPFAAALAAAFPTGAAVQPSVRAADTPLVPPPALQDEGEEEGGFAAFEDAPAPTMKAAVPVSGGAVDDALAAAFESAPPVIAAAPKDAAPAHDPPAAAAAPPLDDGFADFEASDAAPAAIIPAAAPAILAAAPATQARAEAAASSATADAAVAALLGAACRAAPLDAAAALQLIQFQLSGASAAVSAAVARDLGLDGPGRSVDALTALLHAQAAQYTGLQQRLAAAKREAVADDRLEDALTCKKAEAALKTEADAAAAQLARKVALPGGVTGGCVDDAAVRALFISPLLAAGEGAIAPSADAAAALAAARCDEAVSVSALLHAAAQVALSRRAAAGAAGAEDTLQTVAAALLQRDARDCYSGPSLVALAAVDLSTTAAAQLLLTRHVLLRVALSTPFTAGIGTSKPGFVSGSSCDSTGLLCAGAIPEVVSLAAASQVAEAAGAESASAAAAASLSAAAAKRAPPVWSAAINNAGSVVASVAAALSDLCEQAGIATEASTGAARPLSSVAQAVLQRLLVPTAGAAAAAPGSRLVASISALPAILHACARIGASLLEAGFRDSTGAFGALTADAERVAALATAVLRQAESVADVRAGAGELRTATATLRTATAHVRALLSAGFSGEMAPYAAFQALQRVYTRELHALLGAGAGSDAALSATAPARPLSAALRNIEGAEASGLVPPPALPGCVARLLALQERVVAHGSLSSVPLCEVSAAGGAAGSAGGGDAAEAECCAVCLCTAAAASAGSAAPSTRGGLLAAVLASAEAPATADAAAPLPACGAVERLSGGATACHRVCLDLWTWNGGSGDLPSPGRGSEGVASAWSLSVLAAEAGRKALARHVRGSGVSIAAGVTLKSSSGGPEQPVPTAAVTLTAPGASSMGSQAAAGAPRPPAGSVSISDAFDDLLG